MQTHYYYLYHAIDSVIKNACLAAVNIESLKRDLFSRKLLYPIHVSG